MTYAGIPGQRPQPPAWWAPTPATAGLVLVMVLLIVINILILMPNRGAIAPALAGADIPRSQLPRGSELKALEGLIDLAQFLCLFGFVSFVWWFSSRYSRMAELRVSGEHFSPSLLAGASVLPAVRPEVGAGSLPKTTASIGLREPSPLQK